MRNNYPLPIHHPREGGGLARRRKATFICTAKSVGRIPAFTGVVRSVVATVVFLIFSSSHAQAIPMAPPAQVEREVVELKDEASTGDIEAQKKLALLYLDGFEQAPCELTGGARPQCTATWIKPDYAVALKYFKQAADAGDAWAQTYTGWLYYKGIGVDQDFKVALKWGRQAEAQGYPGAQDMIGRMYRDGQGVPQNYATAVEYFKKAVLQFHWQSEWHLGRLYASGGPDFPQDYEQALFWLKLSGNPDWSKFESHNFFEQDTEELKSDIFDVEKRLTAAQITKIEKQIKEYKMPPPTKWDAPVQPCILINGVCLRLMKLYRNFK